MLAKIIQKFNRSEILEQKGGEYDKDQTRALATSTGGFSLANLVFKPDGGIGLNSWPGGPVISIPRTIGAIMVESNSSEPSTAAYNFDGQFNTAVPRDQEIWFNV